jgi:hypothetical protein
MEAETVVRGERRSEPTQRHSHGGGVAQLLLLDLDRNVFSKIIGPTKLPGDRDRDCAVAVGGVLYFPLSCILHCHFPSPRLGAMATKRKRDDDEPVVHSADALRTPLSSTITSYDTAKVALLHIRSEIMRFHES